MKHLSFLLLIVLGCSCKGVAQTSITCTNLAAEGAMLGNYTHAPRVNISGQNYADTISRGINARVSPDSLHAYLDVLRKFGNRNSGSDTASNTTGIGAARRWVFSKFADFSAREGGRLIPSYLQFNIAMCGQSQHRNIMAVLPGTDTTDKSIVVIEAHIDSRCAGLCDTACLAEGMEDNGSGTALVIELARVMSRYTYKQTIVFVVVIGEEQGLYGGKAFSDYCVQKGIKVKACLNNDVIGGIICGQTSSAPSCPGLNAIDSTDVRLFSFGGFNSPHKQLARWVKLEYKEQLRAQVAVPMAIQIMTPEDRTGRGGDHIPFRQNGQTAIRFTSANEHGDASLGAGYTDRQHTSSDILGVDRDNDGKLDSFFVDFNYLARNAVINGNALAMEAIGPMTPGLTLGDGGVNKLSVQFTGQTSYPKYRIGLRTTTNDWDTVYTFSGAGPYAVSLPAANYIVSAASVDALGVESLFSAEQTAAVKVGLQPKEPPAVELLQNNPNPFDEMTRIGVLVRAGIGYREAYVLIADAGSGKVVQRLPITLNKGVTEVVFKHGYGARGVYVYSLVVDGTTIDSRKMVFAN